MAYLRGREAAEGLPRDDFAGDFAGTSGVCAEIARSLRAEPGRFAPGISNDRVLLILGSLDDKVPYATGLELRDRLGEPETIVIPLGHYTGIIAAPFAAGDMFEYFRRRFGMLVES